MVGRSFAKNFDGREVFCICSKMKSLSARLLDVFERTENPSYEAKSSNPTDAGPGVGVSNFEVKFRDAELARLWNSDYRIRLHWSRGDRS